MRVALFILLLLSTGWLQAQEKWDYVPFSEAERAMKVTERDAAKRDTLKRQYHNRWVLGVLMGRRYISAENKTPDPDVLTFTDFRERRGFLGVEVGRFLGRRLLLGFMVDLLLLPKEEDFTIVSFTGPGGINIEGTANGGAMINLGLQTRYFFRPTALLRPYMALKLGKVNVMAAGGRGGINPDQGSFQEAERLRHSYNYLQPATGLAWRMSPGTLLDFHIAYLIATNPSQNIGQITSPGGFSATLGLQFVIGGDKE